ncbi:hypothetical protein AVEN_230943-1 [Araneus ventricosus]|uniref:Uncharacterized protein n=1 Tax=Araneus ventricosus TaxID=182803 RepID=A0A4Y2A2W6_ARAVE|nr:hypothetical protein AVEN_230943-1 [Araneus ventricosus]
MLLRRVGNAIFMCFSGEKTRNERPMRKRRKSALLITMSHGSCLQLNTRYTCNACLATSPHKVDKILKASRRISAITDIDTLMLHLGNVGSDVVVICNGQNDHQTYPALINVSKV